MPRRRNHFPNANRNALRRGTAGDVLPSAAILSRGIPWLITDSPSWRLQCDADSRGLKRGTSEPQFAELLQRRAEYYCLNRPIPSYELDQNYVRFEREDGYCVRLSSVTDAEVESWDGPSPDLLFHTPPVMPSGAPGPSWEMSHADRQQYMPMDWVSREAQWRQQHNCFIACHQTEVRGLSSTAIQTRNVRLPRALLQYATPSFLDVETPTIVTYLGVHLMRHPHSRWWFVLVTEWIRNAAIAALYWSRRGRLPWLSVDLCRAITDLGIPNIFRDADIQTEFGAVMREIELVNWPSVSPANRLLPRYSSSHTLVYTSGDWVAYLPSEQESHLPDSLYVAEDPERYGFARGGRPSRGLPLFGPLDGQESISFHELYGFPREKLEPKCLTQQSRPANAPDSLRNRQLQHWLRQHGAAGLMVRLGYDPELPVDSFITLFKDLLVLKHGPVANVWPLTNSSPTPVVVVDDDVVPVEASAPTVTNIPSSTVPAPISQSAIAPMTGNSAGVSASASTPGTNNQSPTAASVAVDVPMSDASAVPVCSVPANAPVSAGPSAVVAATTANNISPLTSVSPSNDTASF